jgi:hypothetical protein
MKKTFLVLMTAAVLILAGSAVWASTYPLTILDDGSGTYGVTATDGGSWDSHSFSYATEKVWGTLTDSNLTFPYSPSKSASVILTEAGGGYSDFLTLYSDSWENKHTLYFTFESDGATGFAADVAAVVAANNHLSYVAETGGVQDLTSYFTAVLDNCGADFCVTVKSCEEVVPLPPTVLLLGSGLVSLALLRRRFKG